MFPICRIGDSNQMGGVIIDGASTVFSSFQPVGFIGSSLSEHGPWDRYSHPPHINAVVTDGSATVFAEFRPVARMGSMNSCGHSMTQGDPTVIVL
jgi:uncharacterized Zn-binding protein involved in type VI secretion